MLGLIGSGTLPLIIFFKKLGVPPNHQIFRLRPSGALIRGKTIFFPENQLFCRKSAKREALGAALGGERILSELTSNPFAKSLNLSIIDYNFRGHFTPFQNTKGLQKLP